MNITNTPSNKIIKLNTTIPSSNVYSCFFLFAITIMPISNIRTSQTITLMQTTLQNLRRHSITKCPMIKSGVTGAKASVAGRTG